MKITDVATMYFEDPNRIVLESTLPDTITEWLSNQTPDTWHNVATTWNYDYGDEVLSWILQQENCDKGTAAHVFEIVGTCEWLGDEALAKDENNLCSIILKNWDRYNSGEFYNKNENREMYLDWVHKYVAKGMYADTPILDVAHYTGSRDAQSRFESEDGEIIVNYYHWMKANNIEIS